MEALAHGANVLEASWGNPMRAAFLALVAMVCAHDVTSWGKFREDLMALVHGGIFHEGIFHEGRLMNKRASFQFSTLAH